MGESYSVDLRGKVVQAYERRKGSQAEVAQSFGVSLSFVKRLLQLHRRTGSLEPNRKRAGRPAQTDAATCDQVQHWLGRTTIQRPCNAHAAQPGSAEKPYDRHGLDSSDNDAYAIGIPHVCRQRSRQHCAGLSAMRSSGHELAWAFKSRPD
jgi:transposase-like protein